MTIHATTIRPYAPGDEDAVIDLIVGIQVHEFGIAITAEEQPDLRTIPEYYQTGDGAFWVAERDGRIVGSVGLKGMGDKQAALRKMFVATHCRGREQGVSTILLDALLDHAKQRGITDIFLGTVGVLHAAHRFYEKNGFVEIPRSALPASYPGMGVDEKFYRLSRRTGAEA